MLFNKICVMSDNVALARLPSSGNPLCDHRLHQSTSLFAHYWQKWLVILFLLSEATYFGIQWKLLLIPVPQGNCETNSWLMHSCTVWMNIHVNTKHALNDVPHEHRRSNVWPPHQRHSSTQPNFLRNVQAKVLDFTYFWPQNTVTRLGKSMHIINSRFFSN